MEKALLLTGIRHTENGVMESYQLLLGGNYETAEYTQGMDRETFVAEFSEAFADVIAKYGRPLELSAFNGLRIDPTTSKHERTNRLEDSIAAHFSKALCARVQQKTTAIPIPSSN